MDMKISQPIFGILVVLTKNEFTKICNELGPPTYLYIVDDDLARTGWVWTIAIFADV